MVDDQEMLLDVVVRILKRANFHVLSAVGGSDAIRVAKEYSRTIDLLLSDIEMPGMCGPELGEVLKKERPGLHVMLMSCGAGGNLLVLNYGWAYIQKPFVPSKLVEMINAVLHSPNRSQLGGYEFDRLKDESNQ